MTTPRETAVDPGADPTMGALVHDLTDQMSTLVRDEMRLAQAELTEKGKRAGIGIGMFSAAGLLAFFGFAVLLATVILALALVLPAWVAALIVAVVLFAGAAVAALVGKKNVSQATPPVPEQAIDGVKQDVETVKGKHAHVQ
ncbi:MAG: phage holin family protein [Nocardioidaceae bacterium]